MSSARAPGGPPGGGGGGGPGSGVEIVEYTGHKDAGPPPADFLTLVTFAVLDEENYHYIEVDAHRRFDAYRVYLYNQTRRATGTYHFKQPRGGTRFTIQPDQVTVVKAMVELYNVADEDESDSEDVAIDGMIHEVVSTVTVLRRDRWHRWKPRE